MAGRIPVIYFDACIFISMITRELRRGDETAQIAGLVPAIERRELIPVTSALTRAEVLECNLDFQQKTILRKLLNPPKVQVKDVSSPILDLSLEIREYYQALKMARTTNLPTVETPDAIHLATAIYYECDMLFTFDEADRETGRLPKRGLIPLSGIVAGRYPMTICKPSVRAPGLSV